MEDPKYIYLNHPEDAYYVLDLEHLTWSMEKIEKNDVRYVRWTHHLKLVKRLKAKIKKLESTIGELEDTHGCVNNDRLFEKIMFEKVKKARKEKP